jgi:enoyl-CoA hydratase/carnithine racemase
VTSEPTVLSPREFRARCADAEALERYVTDAASPTIVVALDGPAHDEPLPVVAPTTPVVIVGIADRPAAVRVDACDVLLTAGDEGGSRGWVHADDLDAAVRTIIGAGEATPGAAVTLAQLLRVSATMPIAGAVVAESFAYSMLLAGSEFAAWLAAQPARRHHVDEEPVLVGTDADGTITITMNRPAVHHAYDAATRDALVDVLRGLTALPDPPRVVLRSDGPSFGSGGDLSEFGTTRDPVRAHAIRTARSAGLLLHSLGTVTARVQGACIGAGIELPAFCHRVVASADATFRLPEVAMGLIPGAGGTASITARVGRHRTAYLALSGATLSATGAHRWGLVDAIEDRAQ